MSKSSKSSSGKPRPSVSSATGAPKPRTNSMVKPKHNGASKPSLTSASTNGSNGLQHHHSHSHSQSMSKVPMSPASLPSTQSRKPSVASINFQHQLGIDEEDLSSKPRCQRCRKSKKGCDRQRPCGRCRDAGIGIEGCVSEDEGNGRKGRYGRHMGVPIKKGEEGYEESIGSNSPGMGGMMMSAPADPMAGITGAAFAAMSGGPAGPLQHHMPPLQAAGMAGHGYFLAPALPNKDKKRKR